ncbi:MULTISPECIES: 5'/3'-nucleotidase SurE [unclassified Nostoc]|uniref:5'/3'-nucleotidase SurE n=1 Tax=unclassified Nostoc TaxID=2593658 RepID=UPI002AD2450B|nr:5'/3'-nucleotidase SurE [Nostoc sp. DedQUE03]MDZ7976264.1 5'/3'-nucleotidase SurE [Nostoc sp. DedQUE03]MDZ8044935.1 5'/3'-nucleotidase SurE [Nostoc sp. DedQUE02]
MTIILTNDDGIDAPGIQALLKAVKGKNTIIAAPADHQSGCGHQVTTTRGINLQRRSQTEYAIAGTPADCVRIAISQINADVKFILSGINAGGNLGVDVYISGTVAAVREGAMHGIPGVAISQYRKAKQNFDWDLAGKLTAEVLADLLKRPLEPGSFWNVNLPHLQPGEPDPNLVFCQPCTKPLPVNYRIEGDDFYYVGEYSKRDRTPGSDVDVCFSGNIAVTQLRV